MRCTALALALLLIPAAAVPSRAQAWGDGWRPCYGPCGSWGGGGWAGPPLRFMDGPAFAPGAWWSPRAVRWRRLAARRRAIEAEQRAEAAPVAPGPRFSGWVWHRWPEPVAAAAKPPRRDAAARAPARPLTPRDDETVAAMPVEALHSTQRPSRPVAASHVFAAAAMARRPAVARPVIRAVVRPPEPAVRPQGGPRAAVPTPQRPPAGVAQRRLVHPAALRSEPAAPQPAPAAAAAAPASAPAPAAPTSNDVPVAPLD